MKTARESLRDLRVAEVVQQDLHLDEGGEIIFRTKLRLSFKYDVAHAHVHQWHSQPGASGPDLRGFRPDLGRPSAPLLPDAPGVDLVRAPQAGCRAAYGRPARQRVTTGRSHRIAAVSPGRGNGRFPYTGTAGGPAKIIAGANG